MKFSFHPEAEVEFFETVEYYEECEPGLGRAYSTEVLSAILRILDYPAAWAVLDGTVRRCIIHRFPYAVLYNIEEDSIFILAVMPLRRDPEYWKSRRK